MRSFPICAAALLLAACSSASSPTPFALTLDPTSLTTACPTLSAQVSVGGGAAVPVFTVSQGGAAVTKSFSAGRDVVVQIDADCLNGGQSVGHSRLIQYGNSTATAVSLTVRPPQPGDDPKRYQVQEGTVPPSIQ